MWCGLYIYWYLLWSNLPSGSTVSLAFNLHRPSISPSLWLFPALALSFSVTRPHPSVPLLSSSKALLVSGSALPHCLPALLSNGAQTQALACEDGSVCGGIAALFLSFSLNLFSTGRRRGGYGRDDAGWWIRPSDHPWCHPGSRWCVPVHGQ